MGEFTLNGWQDYWHHFDQLVDMLSADHKAEFVAELKDAQGFVNRLTDGWYQFSEALHKAISQHRSEMNTEQYELASFLAKSIKDTLRIR